MAIVTSAPNTSLQYGADHSWLVVDNKPVSKKTAEALCDELLEHVFECDACINGFEEACEVYCSFQKRIAQAGGASKAAILAV